MNNHRYSPEFKDEAVRQIIEAGHSVPGNPTFERPVRYTLWPISSPQIISILGLSCAWAVAAKIKNIAETRPRENYLLIITSLLLYFS
jgi:hypothetical protein